MSTQRVRAANSLSGAECVMGARMHFAFLFCSHVVNVGDLMVARRDKSSQ